MSFKSLLQNLKIVLLCVTQRPLRLKNLTLPQRRLFIFNRRGRWVTQRFKLIFTYLSCPWFRYGTKWSVFKYLVLTATCLIPGLSHAEDLQATEERQIPGQPSRPVEFPPFIYESIPNINSSASEFIPVEDRWRQFYVGKWYDPYNQNVLKADIPIFGSPGHEWFFETAITSDTLFERRRLALPVGFASTSRPGSLDVFGDGDQFVASQNIFTSFALIQGATAFKPPEYELRIAPAFNFNHVNGNETGTLFADPMRGEERSDEHVSFQELFADIHLANISERYDFISTRIGIQKFISDFRGFIFSDEAPGIRFFGNYDNNKYQFNLAYFSRLNKDTNSGLNTLFEQRYEDVVVFNLYRQDLLTLGHQVAANIVYRGDSAGDHEDHYDNNGFLVRPAAVGDRRDKNIYSTYMGLTGDGHFDRINSTTALYYVMGSESHNPIAGQETDISAGMAAQEFSYDQDWLRYRISVMWASGDSNPGNSKATGFDGIFENPNFAGGNLGYFQREGLPFIAGGGVNLMGPMSFYPNLGPGKAEGQSNFVNPGLRLYNIGLDVEVTQKVKLINNLSYLQFDQPESLQQLRHDSAIDNEIGLDLSTGIIYRPFLNNNVQIKAGTGFLIPSDGLKRIYGDDTLYHAFTNLILVY